ncbi:MAG TPA: DUF5683 domain-containing protein [Candidatus Krumholzibacteriaceae bacterium]
MRKPVLFFLVMLLVALVSFEAYGGENVWYSVFVPGWGQVRAGHYGRGSIFLSAEIVSLTTLVISDIQYDRAVEQYDRARALYLHATYIGDAVQEYDRMHAQWDSAERLHGYREKALYAALGVWAVNVVDMILFDEKGEPPLSFEGRPGGFLVTGSISF